ncbi:MAG TPA: cytochrome c [Thermoanaerobaculia bacterium]|nr:cytochrome c [Thermoanaerobaculia bacterium]
MNPWLQWFRRLTWIGVAANLGFILPALFQPDVFDAMLGPGASALSYVWLGNAGLMLALATMFYMPAGKDPLRYPVYAWLSVLGRGLAASFWIWQKFRWGLSGPIQQFWIMDTVFGILFLVLLTLGFKGSGDAKAASAQPSETPASLPGLAAFRWALIVTVLAELAFAIPGVLVPDRVAAWLQTSEVAFNYVWLGNAALLLLQIGIFSLPVLRDPVRLRVYAWLAVAARAALAIFWLIQLIRWDLTGPSRLLFAVETVLAVVLAYTLHRILPASSRLGLANLAGFFRGLAADVGRVLRSPLDAVLAVLVLVAGGLLSYGIYVNLIKPEPDVVYSDPADQFKYGAIGLSMANRVPEYVFNVMPEVCPDLLPGPGGWASLGILYEKGKDLPVGFSRRQIGYPSVEPNCAFCHTGGYRTEAGAPQQIALGAPAHQLDLQSFQWFLYNCAQDPRFTTDNVLSKIEQTQDLGWFEKQVYRFAILPIAKSGLEMQAEAYAWQKSRPAQGRGRTDTFNPTKITVFHIPDDGTIGTVDLPAIWNQKPRVGMHLHWDGNNDDITERNYAAAMAIGATPDSVIVSHFDMVTNFVLELPPPKFPFPVDQTKVERGAAIFQANCADCHAFGSPNVGKVTPIAAVATDPHRLKSFTPGLVTAFHSIEERPFVFGSYSKTEGYANLPIDGTWARAPYLHNGSVPTLWDLLQTPDKRPAKFYRGNDVYDPVKMGFVTDPPTSYELDTTVAGNSNMGHLYGTDLTDEQKWDLIEFLKTF